MPWSNTFTNTTKARIARFRLSKVHLPPSWKEDISFKTLSALTLSTEENDARLLRAARSRQTKVWKLQVGACVLINLNSQDLNRNVMARDRC